MLPFWAEMAKAVAGRRPPEPAVADVIGQRQTRVADTGREQFHQHGGDRAVHHRHKDDQIGQDGDDRQLLAGEDVDKVRRLGHGGVVSGNQRIARSGQRIGNALVKRALDALGSVKRGFGGILGGLVGALVGLFHLGGQVLDFRAILGGIVARDDRFTDLDRRRSARFAVNGRGVDRERIQLGLGDVARVGEFHRTGRVELERTIRRISRHDNCRLLRGVQRRVGRLRS